MARKQNARTWGLLASVLLLLLTLPAYAGSLSDDFSGASLDPKWTVSVLGDAKTQPASATVVGGKLKLVAAGTDITGSSDNGIFVWQPATGDFRITLKLESFTSPDPSAKLGLWIRQDLDNTGPNVMPMAMPKGLHIQGRDTRGGSTTPDSTGRIAWTDSNTSDNNGDAPVWIRVTRTGNDFKMEVSFDGTTWVPPHDPKYASKDVRTVAMPPAVLVGIGMTSHNKSTTATGIVDDFTFEQISGGPAAGQGFATAYAVDANGFPVTAGVTLAQGGKVVAGGISGTPALLPAGEVVANAASLTLKGTPVTGNIPDGGAVALAVPTAPAGAKVADLSTAAGQAWIIKLPTSATDDYSKPDASEAGFQPYNVPSGDWDTIDPQDNIYGWIRTKVVIPKEFAGRDLMLQGWNLDDEDWTYWNGNFIGHTNSWNTLRSYFIPGFMVNEGLNVLAIKGRDGTGGGGITQSAPVLMAVNQAGAISGTIKNAAGQPMPYLTVRATAPFSDWGPVDTTVTTGADGTYVLYGLAPGNYTVKVDSPSVTPTPTSKDVTIAGGQMVVVDFSAEYIPFFPDPVDLSASDAFLGTILNPKWTAQDIGRTKPGSASVRNNTLTINADGADFWDDQDRGYIVFQKYSGDFVATVRVNSVPTTDGWAKAGIDLRVDNTTGSVHVITAATRDNGYAIQGRTAANTTNEFNFNGGAFQPGSYLRVDRIGTTVRSFWSPDGKTVYFIGQQTVPALSPNDLLVALAVTSHSDGNVGTATFSDFRIGGFPSTQAPPPPVPPTGDMVITTTNAAGAPGETVQVSFLANDAVRSIGSAVMVLNPADTTPAGGPPLVPGALEAGPLAQGATSALQPDGTVKVTFAQPLQGPGLIATQGFQIPANATPGTIYHVFGGTQLFDAAGNPAPVQFIAGNILVTPTSVAAMALTVQPASGLPGQMINVGIKANSAVSGIFGANLKVTLTPLIPSYAPPLTFGPASAVKTGIIVPIDGIAFAQAASPTVAQVGVAALTQIDGPGTLLTVPVQIPQNAQQWTTYNVHIEGTVVMNGVDVPIKTNDGAVMVRIRLLGDLNGDGRITPADATLAIRVAIGLTPPTMEILAAGDLNGDGRISVGEATVILRTAVGLSTQIPNPHIQGAGGSV